MTKKLSRTTKIILAAFLLLICGVALLYSIPFFNQPKSGQVKDGALLAGRETSRFAAADEDYFHDMDSGVQLGLDEIKGRNTWLVRSGRNDRLWNTMMYKSAGVLDFLTF